MAPVAREVRERAQHERVAQQVGAGQREAALLHDRRTVQEEIEVQRARTVVRTGAVAPACVLHRVERFAHGPRILDRVECDDEVVEVVALEAHRTVAIDRRHAQRTEAARELLQPPAQVVSRVDVAADGDEDLARHGALQPPRRRSMRTPTFCAPRIAPGLLTDTRTHSRPYSSMRTAAIFSASVSTSWKRVSSTQATRRFARVL